MNHPDPHMEMSTLGNAGFSYRNNKKNSRYARTNNITLALFQHAKL